MSLERWRAYAVLFRGSRRMLTASVAASLAQSAALIPIALLVREAFNSAIPGGDGGELVLIGAAMLGLYAVSSGLGLWTRHTVLAATKRAIALLRGRLMDKLYSLPRSDVDRRDRATLHSTIVQDSERLDVMSNALMAQLLPAAIVSGALGITLVVLDPLLAVLLASVGPAILVIGVGIGRRVRGRARGYQEAFDRFDGGTSIGLLALTLTRVHAAEADELARRAEEHAAVEIAGRRLAFLQAAWTLVNGSVAAVGAVIVLVVGGREVGRGSLTLGDLLSFYAVIGLLRGQAMTVLLTTPQVLAGYESLDRVQELLDADAPDPYTGTREIAFRGGVELRDVGFSYGNQPLLEGVSLRVEPGERVALLGPNGAGKSTVVSLLLGLYRPDRGHLTADGTPYDELDVRALRRAMGVVLQDPVILPGTVADNIAFGRPDAARADIEAAARASTADAVIAELPDGLDTDVGDDGGLLSGGQRQRIAIARALMGDPRLLVLDEPSTHLDDAALAGLLERLAARPGAPAILFVTHDATVAAAADRVVELRDGRVARGAPQPTTVSAPGATP